MAFEGQDSRGKSIWDVLSHTTGKITNSDTGDIVADSYRRWPEDIKLLKDIGLNACRFSLAWLRIAPDGDTEWNRAGLAYYDGIVDAGIEPWITLFYQHGLRQ